MKKMTLIPAALRNEIPNMGVHTSCICYQENKMKTVRHNRIAAGDRVSINLDAHAIIIVVDGAVRLSVNGMPDSITINRSEFIFLPIGARFECEALEAGGMMTFRLDKVVGNVPECHTFRFQRTCNPMSQHNKPESGLFKLKANDRISSFFELAQATELDGLKCGSYAQLLLGQLLYLIQVYYPQQEYTRFYSSILSPDVVFSDFVYENWRKCATVNDLAKAGNVTPQQFTIRFRKVFGEAPGMWLKRRRAADIYHDICGSHKTLKAIALEYDMDMSNFIRYCRMNFGQTPGVIRAQLNAEPDTPHDMTPMHDAG